MSINKIHECRSCKNKNLIRILELGDQFLTGVFPSEKNSKVSKGPLNLVKCDDKTGCGLLQLEHSYDLNEMYGENYGYRSGLNRSMVEHLNSKIKKIEEKIKINKNDMVIDIGSNDGTSLKAYENKKIKLVGVDPSAAKFIEFYDDNIQLIVDFYSSELIKNKFGTQKAKVITSFSMFYDLEDPIQFMKNINDVLDENGIWVFEQSYMPSMFETNSFDTVCHEHVEFYRLTEICWMAEKSGLKIIDVEFNDVNGGSFSVTAAKRNSNYKIDMSVHETLEKEKIYTQSMDKYYEFANNVKKFKKEIKDFIKDKISKGKKFGALGASTKGNVLLQYCELTNQEIVAIGEVNPDKFGKLTPGTFIPIIEENELFKLNLDYIMILPWHFRKFFMDIKELRKENLIFPLPTMEIIYARR